MGPSENPTAHPENQEGRRRRVPRRPRGAPRARLCLLKGCEKRFHPGQPRQRYCSEDCQEAARKWSRWRAQQRYRASTSGKQRRNDQSQRYRKRIQSRKPTEPEAVDETARVITKNFFRGMLRPARLLRDIRAPAAQSLTTFLLGRLPARVGTRRRTGAALETGAHLIRRY